MIQPRTYPKHSFCLWACVARKDANAELNLENEIMDIEDIVKFSEQHSRELRVSLKATSRGGWLFTVWSFFRACPYYLSRENQQKAEIIFVPYNYLIDVNARKTQNLDLKNCIVIFDEAHNLYENGAYYLNESSCGEAASFEITPTDLANCIQEAQICYEYALKPGYSGYFDASAFDILKGRLLRLEDEIDKLEIPSSTQELIRPGEFMYELLNLIGVNGGNFELLQKAMEAAINILAGIELDEAKRHRKYAINHLLLALKMVFRSDFFLQGEQTFTHTKYYKVGEWTPRIRKLPPRFRKLP
ncbi:LOW QUALITY PROTEIN: hypothetical protein BC937DRAFT_86260 [Endogone sp. FLAS-F59071]|nr:LOW QUALITY PROTEIN: hypothetical protein BC937DRAFT_86260 [Endogone sp. FLAS-F59071]|eukprot:RUS13151.1 LOW QUALITY PROTEIN: hypothetical protein BC937DRAFT_86260 [Endogone sp. FLAS-F59071]